MTFFLSYSSADQAIASQLAKALLVEGVKLWKDNYRIRPGDRLSDEIVAAIEKASFFCILLSRDALASDWVRLELEVALASESAAKRGFILPVLLEDCEIPESLADLRFLDFRNDPDRGVESLVRHVARTYSVAHSGRSTEPFNFWFDYTVRTFDTEDRTFFELDMVAIDKEEEHSVMAQVRVEVPITEMMNQDFLERILRQYPRADAKIALRGGEVWECRYELPAEGEPFEGIMDFRLVRLGDFVEAVQIFPLRAHLEQVLRLGKAPNA